MHAVRVVILANASNFGDQGWPTFLKNHAKAILAGDFFVAVTATFRMLHVFVVIEHSTRRLSHVNVTANPNADWTLQQLREVVGNGGGYRYLIHDQDRIFAKHLDASIRALGVQVLRSSVASLGSEVTSLRCLMVDFEDSFVAAPIQCKFQARVRRSLNKVTTFFWNPFVPASYRRASGYVRRAYPQK